ncbi:MAG: glycine zipper family protein [Acetobacteraceae bacterium]
MKYVVIIAVALTIPLVGCSNMSPTEQRALSGTGIGAAGGAVIGAIAGNAGLGAGIGAAAGLASGLLYDQVQKESSQLVPLRLRGRFPRICSYTSAITRRASARSFPVAAASSVRRRLALAEGPE